VTSVQLEQVVVGLVKNGPTPTAVEDSGSGVEPT
jgi:hypothetical protein